MHEKKNLLGSRSVGYYYLYRGQIPFPFVVFTNLLACLISGLTYKTNKQTKNQFSVWSVKLSFSRTWHQRGLNPQDPYPESSKLFPIFFFSQVSNPPSQTFVVFFKFCLIASFIIHGETSQTTVFSHIG